MRVSPDKIIYSNPIKSEKDLITAGKNGITVTTADSINEVHKIKKHAPNMKIVWRIKTEEYEKSNISFHKKFGDDLSTEELARKRFQ
jgi:diaminopimelate decarboxylase